MKDKKIFKSALAIIMAAMIIVLAGCGESTAVDVTDIEAATAAVAQTTITTAVETQTDTQTEYEYGVNTLPLIAYNNSNCEANYISGLNSGSGELIIMNDGNLYAYFANGSIHETSPLDYVLIDENVRKIVSVFGWINYYIKDDNTLWIGFDDDDVETPYKVMDNVADIYVLKDKNAHVNLAVLKTDKSLWVLEPDSYGDISNDQAYEKFKEIDKDVVKVFENGLYLKSNGDLCYDSKCYSGRFLLTPFYAVSEPQGNVIAKGVMDYVFYDNPNTQYTIQISGELLKYSSGKTEIVSEEVKKAFYDFESQSTLRIIKNDNSLWAMGQNQYGQIGDGTLENKTSFVKIGENVKAADNYFYITNDNKIFVWDKFTMTPRQEEMVSEIEEFFRFRRYGEYEEVIQTTEGYVYNLNAPDLADANYTQENYIIRIDNQYKDRWRFEGAKVQFSSEIVFDS